MITITIIKKNQKIITVEANGHSGYAEHGADIICSAVSTLTQNLINSLTEIAKIDAKYMIDESIPHLSVTIPLDLSKEDMNTSQLFMKSAVLGLKNLANSYTKYIKIKEIYND